MIDDKIEIKNVNTPGRSTRVNRAKYEAMKNAMIKALPKKSPGLTRNEIREAVKPYLDQTHFPGGKTSGWWAKTVQLDLEARKLMVREKTKPRRWFLK